MNVGLSVIVPHLNDAANLANCLASLAAQRLAPGRMEVIVVDNGSREPPHALVAGFPGVRLAEEPVPGPGPARNRGAALARGGVLAFTDSDCLADPDWAAAILARFAADPGLEIIGGDIRVSPAVPGRPSPAEAYDMLYGFRQERQITRQRFSATANLAVRREVFAAVGPFAGIEAVEDLDWGQRAHRLGHVTRYVPEMIVHHPARPSMAALRAQWNRHTSHHFRLRVTGPAGRLAWTLRGLAMAVSPLTELPHLLSTDKLATPYARWQALRGLVAVRLYRSRRMLLCLFDPTIRAASVEWNRR